MSSKVENCPFCKSNIKEIAFISSKNFYAICNKSPILPGHSLIIPKNHVESYLDLTDDQLFELSIISKKAIKILLNYYKGNSFNLSIQEQKPAGQTISHFHQHIIPRNNEDLPEAGDWYPKLMENYMRSIDNNNRKNLGWSELKQIASNLRSMADISY